MKLLGWVTFGFMPFVVYPVHVGLSWLQDIAFGEQSILFSLRYTAKRRLLDQFFLDWWSSLPSSIFLVIGLMLPTFLVLRRLLGPRTVPFVLAVVVECAVVSIFLNGFEAASMVVFLLLGLILSAILGLLNQVSLPRRGIAL